MKSGTGTVADIQEAVHIHPALPEVGQARSSSRLSLITDLSTIPVS